MHSRVLIRSRLVRSRTSPYFSSRCRRYYREMTITGHFESTLIRSAIFYRAPGDDVDRKSAPRFVYNAAGGRERGRGYLFVPLEASQPRVIPRCRARISSRDFFSRRRDSSPRSGWTAAVNSARRRILLSRPRRTDGEKGGMNVSLLHERR